MPSNIHVFVRLKEQCIFAGEELNCIITFRNVDDIVEPSTPVGGSRRTSRQGSISQLAAQSPRTGFLGRGQLTPRLPSKNNQTGDVSVGTKPVTSLVNVPVTSAISSPNPSAVDKTNNFEKTKHRQQRSVSIISGTSPVVASNQMLEVATPPIQNSKSNHGRSSTVGTFSSSQNTSKSFDKDIGNPRLSKPGGRRSPLSSNATSSSAATSQHSTPDFRFHPDSSQDGNATFQNSQLSNSANPQNGSAVQVLTKHATSNLNTTASERSSGEFYSLSNQSEETLMSEQPSILSDPIRVPSITVGTHYRTDSRSRPPRRPQAVNLLMGYAQISANFTVDGSFIDQSQFEEVKRKGFVGGQAGGGVVGVNKARPNSGFLGNFSFNSIGESLSNLVGSDSLSSVREMNAVTNARSIPLLSTPQSLLFVNLHLEPGAEKSFSFSYGLPQGLPSTYRGKAIKIVYNLTVGVQGVPGGKDKHAVRQVSIPFRVFPGVNSEGEIFGHDLMQPHVVLRDVARTKSIDPTDIDEPITNAKANSSGFGTTEFLQFVDGLLDRNRRRQSSSGTMEVFFGNANDADERKAVQAINRAILTSNQTSAGNDSSPTRFEITRDGLKAGVVVLDRALHRLGETVTTTIDFSDRQITCTSVHATLETTERISSSLAVRSAATLNRVSKRVYASHSENVLFSRRTVFLSSIPSSASPTFVSSGINLDWSIRLEFGTIKPTEKDDGEVEHIPELLEELISDERGIVSVGVENLECETFEVIIPLTVYGDKVSDGKEGEDIVGIPL